MNKRNSQLNKGEKKEEKKNHNNASIKLAVPQTEISSFFFLQIVHFLSIFFSCTVSITIPAILVVLHVWIRSQSEYCRLSQVLNARRPEPDLLLVIIWVDPETRK
ncbi:hypothetical protein SAY87_009704 [Trapa incisa]|uniref:Uncharacterized protein n=1 Tax=Trapa incisa TaxID=236973 RepID=A0AAN7JZM5_9MYRT|nr:hypothetical protein SAY87_009704 [Trapa incisa]